MSGRAEIAKTLAGTAGPGDVYIHHLGSSEIDVESANSATGIFNMEDKIFRAERGEGQRSGIAGEADFSKMEGYGHYHGEFVKIDGAWCIAMLTQTRLRHPPGHGTDSAAAAERAVLGQHRRLPASGGRPAAAARRHGSVRAHLRLACHGPHAGRADPDPRPERLARRHAGPSAPRSGPT
jgi:SnoaL-like domain